MERRYTVGTRKEQWGGNDTQTLTFIVTEDCNLRCKYCYVTHKSKGKVMPLEVAEKFINYILNSNSIHHADSVILDFIGGEPLLEADLIDKICDYFKIETYKKGLNWYWNYRINISTNGVNYADAKVQNLINKNYGKISVGFSIDGTKEKHDLQRVFPDGRGSYDYIYKNLGLWKSQFVPSTKMTFASEDLKYLKESVIDLWEKGIEDVSANVVYENVWKEGDDQLFEEQLKELADYIIDNDLYDKYYCTLFSDKIGMPYEEADLMMTSCGAGKMIAVDYKGDIYPCMRYCSYSLNHKEPYVIGDINTGINAEKLRPFLLTMYKYQCDEECLNCPVAKGCEFCQGFNYDEADTSTNFQKAKYICKMHKARVKANNYYFAKLYHKKGIKRSEYYWKKELQFMIGSNAVTTCSVSIGNRHNEIMDYATIKKGLKFAENNFMRPVFLHSEETANVLLPLLSFEEYEILHYIPIEAFKDNIPVSEYQIIVSLKTLSYIEKIQYQDILFFNIPAKEIKQLYGAFVKLAKKCNRINANIIGLDKDFDFSEYEKQLRKCAEWIAEEFKKHNEIKELSLLVDLLYINKHEACSAGDTQFTYAPDGKFYICPAFYENSLGSIGTPESGINILNNQLLKPSHMPLCKMCDCFHCENCKYINKKETGEFNVSPSFQCIKAQVEKRVSKYLQDLLGSRAEIKNYVKESCYEDPIEQVGKWGIYQPYHGGSK